MNRVIIEIQTDNGTTSVVPPIAYTDPVEAEAVFLEKCAYARRSGLDTHTVILLDSEGKQIAKKCFKE